MKIQELADLGALRLINDGGNGETEISGIFCCDLLSHAMGFAPADGVWITVMNNINTLAVASLTECGAIVLACGMPAEESFVKKAEQQDITIYACEEPIFETALMIHEQMKKEQNV